jgi:alpha-N-arabinofuranosidase
MSSIRTAFCISAASLMALSGRAQITVVKPIPARATVTVNAGKSAGAPIPRTIFGSFLEPIGNSTYNGLWADEQNRREAQRPQLVPGASSAPPQP